MKGEGTMGPYYAGAGPDDGTLMYSHVAGSIEVFEDPACTAPIGTAHCIGWDPAGSAVWRLSIPDGDDDGPWVIVDREFVGTRSDCREFYRADTHHDLGRGRRWTARRRRQQAASLQPKAQVMSASAS
jgi:hypothetical protein